MLSILSKSHVLCSDVDGSPPEILLSFVLGGSGKRGLPHFPPTRTELLPRQRHWRGLLIFDSQMTMTSHILNDSAQVSTTSSIIFLASDGSSTLILATLSFEC